MTLREWAEAHLDEVRIKIMDDPMLYKEHGGEAVEVMNVYLETMACMPRFGVSPQERTSHERRL